MAKKDSPLVITGFTKYYGSVLAVDDVSLQLKPGEVFGFLGPNGAGKSTTIRSILNFISPSKGRIEVMGLDSVTDTIAVKQRVGYLAGDIALYDEMTGQQLFKYLSALGKDTNWQYVEELVNKLDANPRVRIKSLSKGNKQKIGLIQAFMHQPEILILDEPTSGLDPLMKQVFYDMVDAMRQQGKTVFVSSHDLTEVQKICDRAAFIRQGKMIALEDVKKLDKLNFRRFTVQFDKVPTKKQLQKIKGLEGVEFKNSSVTMTVTGKMDAFIKGLAEFNVQDLDERETTLEDIFMHYYEEDGNV